MSACNDCAHFGAVSSTQRLFSRLFAFREREASHARLRRRDCGNTDAQLVNTEPYKNWNCFGVARERAAKSNPFTMFIRAFHGEVDELENGRMKRIELLCKAGIGPVHRNRVLRQIVRSN